MSTVGTKSSRILAALQVLIAVCLPLGLVLWAPGDLRIWAAVVLLGEIAFALVRRGLTWMAPLVAACVFAPLFVDFGAYADAWFWGSVTLTIGTAITLTTLALVRDQADAPRGSRPVLIASVALATTGLIAAGLAVAITWQADQQFTAAQTDAAFDDVDTSTGGPVGSDDGTDPLVESPESTAPGDSTAPASVPAGRALARISFLRPSTGEQLVTDQALIVREGVADEVLAKGPGHYPVTAPIGGPGNTAIAGHRTGWGSPFLHLDELKPDDVIELTTRDGATMNYVVRESKLVDPNAAWVLGPDPLGTGEQLLTITTCDPPHSDSGRLVVFAALQEHTPSQA